jgi:hypothetical protein
MVGVVRDNAVTRQMKCWACPDFSTHLKSDSANLRHASPHSQPRTKRSHRIFSLSLGRASNAQHRPARFRWSLMVDDAQKNPSLSFLPRLGVRRGVGRTGRSSVQGTREFEMISNRFLVRRMCSTRILAMARDSMEPIGKSLIYAPSGKTIRAASSTPRPPLLIFLFTLVDRVAPEPDRIHPDFHRDPNTLGSRPKRSAMRNPAWRVVRRQEPRAVFRSRAYFQQEASVAA